MKPLIVYGVPFSQPVRAVLWLLLLKRMPFELVLINPGSKGDTGSRNPAYLAKNPSGTIPCIEEPGSGFTLGEAHAIMTYLARTNGWTDVYPDDERVRAKIDSYLHYHHRNIREASIGLVAPKIRKDLDIPELIQMAAKRNLTAALNTLEQGYLTDSKFLMGDSVTLADLAAYVEVGQLPMIHKKNAERFKSWDDINQAGVKVSANLGTTQEQYIKTFFPNATHVVVESPARDWQDVLAGRSDASITSNIEAHKLVEKYPDQMMIVPVDKAKARTPLAVLLPQGDQVWINYVNHWISLQQARGFFDGLKKKWGL